MVPHRAGLVSVSTLLFTLLVSAACQSERNSVRSQLPPLPAFVHQNRSSIELFQKTDQLARQEPHSAERIGRLGMTYHAYRFMAEARRSYELARKFAPDEFRWLYYQGFLEKTVFNFRAAESIFRLALELKPDSAEIWAELGDLYLKWNRPDDAATHLTRALVLDPAQPLAALGQARLALLTENWERAIALLTPILDAHPRLASAPFAPSPRASSALALPQVSGTSLQQPRPRRRGGAASLVRRLWLGNRDTIDA